MSSDGVRTQKGKHEPARTQGESNVGWLSGVASGVVATNLLISRDRVRTRRDQNGAGLSKSGYAQCIQYSYYKLGMREAVLVLVIITKGEMERSNRRMRVFLPGV